MQFVWIFDCNFGTIPLFGTTTGNPSDLKHCTRFSPFKPLLRLCVFWLFKWAAPPIPQPKNFLLKCARLRITSVALLLEGKPQASYGRRSLNLPSGGVATYTSPSHQWISAWLMMVYVSSTAADGFFSPFWTIPRFIVYHTAVVSWASQDRWLAGFHRQESFVSQRFMQTSISINQQQVALDRPQQSAVMMIIRKEGRKASWSRLGTD